MRRQRPYTIAAEKVAQRHLWHGPRLRPPTMPPPYSLDLRRRIVAAARHKAATYAALSRRFAVSRSTVKHYVELVRATGSIAPRPHGGGPPLRLGQRELAHLRALISATPDATLAELVEAVAQRFNIRVTISGMSRALARAYRQRPRSPPLTGR